MSIESTAHSQLSGTPGTGAVHGVFAATGRQGSATADALLERGVRVRALVRRPQSAKARALAERGAEVVYSDLDHPDTLAPAMEGLDALWFMTTMTGDDGPGGEIAMGRALADAAVRSGVGRVVFSSVGGAERDSGVPHFDSKYEVEKYLAGLDLPVTVVRPVFFLENLPYMTSVEGDRVVVRMAIPEDVPLQMIAARDIGRAAATVLVEPDSVAGDSVEIGGVELRGEQIAAEIGAGIGKSGHYEALSLDTHAGDHDSHAMFAWFSDLPAYQADFQATAALTGGTLDLPGWMAATGWQPES